MTFPFPVFCPDSGVGPITLGTITSYSNSADNATQTFTDAVIGDAAADRIVIVAISSAALVTGVTIGGNAATNIVASTSSAYIYALAVPSGTTATIVVSHGVSALSCQITVYPAYGLLNGTTPHDTAYSTTDPSSNDCDTTTRCLGIGVSYVNASLATATWTGLTEDYDTFPESGRRGSMAHEIITTAETPRTISVDYSSGAARRCTVAIFT